MKNRILIKRYSQGLINALSDEAEFVAISEELRSFQRLLVSHEKLRAVLQSPFLPLTKKKELTDDVLKTLSFSPKTSRFIGLCVANERLELLPEILELLPELWNEEKGVSTFEVSSVVPLTEAQKEKLREKLELLANQRVSLKYRSDPSLIAGLSVRRGNIIYDGSLKGNLDRLKENVIKG